MEGAAVFRHAPEALQDVLRFTSQTLSSSRGDLYDVIFYESPPVCLPRTARAFFDSGMILYDDVLESFSRAVQGLLRPMQVGTEA